MLDELCCHTSATHKHVSKHWKQNHAGGSGAMAHTFVPWPNIKSLYSAATLWLRFQTGFKAPSQTSPWLNPRHHLTCCWVGLPARVKLKRSVHCWSRSDPTWSLLCVISFCGWISNKNAFPLTERSVIQALTYYFLSICMLQPVSMLAGVRNRQGHPFSSLSNKLHSHAQKRRKVFSFLD